MIFIKSQSYPHQWDDDRGECFIVGRADKNRVHRGLVHQHSLLLISVSPGGRESQKPEIIECQGNPRIPPKNFLCPKLSYTNIIYMYIKMAYFIIFY